MARNEPVILCWRDVLWIEPLKDTDGYIQWGIFDRFFNCFFVLLVLVFFIMFFYPLVVLLSIIYKKILKII